jgi:putative transposase
MHHKISRKLLEEYEKIRIGKLSTKSIISNLTGNLDEKSKRRLNVLSHYRFREILKMKAVGYKTEIEEVDEYKTSKTCHKCNKYKEDLGANKTYKCEGCKIEIDRDVNAAINIKNGGLRTVLPPKNKVDIS